MGVIRDASRQAPEFDLDRRVADVDWWETVNAIRETRIRSILIASAPRTGDRMLAILATHRSNFSN